MGNALEKCCGGGGGVDEDEDDSNRGHLLDRAIGDDDGDNVNDRNSSPTKKRERNGKTQAAAPKVTKNGRDWDAEKASVLKKRKERKEQKEREKRKKDQEEAARKTREMEMDAARKKRAMEEEAAQKKRAREQEEARKKRSREQEEKEARKALEESAKSKPPTEHRSPPPTPEDTSGSSMSSGVSKEHEDSWNMSTDSVEDPRVKQGKVVKIEETDLQESKKLNTKAMQSKRRDEVKFSTTEDSGADAEILIYICGDGAVGKTCLATSFYECGYFEDKYIPTVFQTKDAYTTAKVNGKKRRVMFRIVDTAGQEDVYNTIETLATTAIDSFVTRPCKVKGIAFFLCHAINNVASFRNSKMSDDDDEENSWIDRIKDAAFDEDLRQFKTKNISLFLVGTKSDQRRKVRKAEVDEEIETLRKNFDGNVKYGECSALMDYDSVKMLFNEALSTTIGGIL
eukprot:g536.t1